MMSLASPDGVLSFACAADAAGTELIYLLGGTDAAAFALSSDKITVTAIEAAAKIENPDMTVA